MKKYLFLLLSAVILWPGLSVLAAVNIWEGPDEMVAVGVCGSTNGGTYALMPTTNLCAAGQNGPVYGTGPWSWNCFGSQAIATCGATKVGVATDGVCGTAHGASTVSAPTSGLCSVGLASQVTGNGPWSWLCNGIDGGAYFQCVGNKATSTAPVCGSAGSEMHASVPTTNLCSVGKIKYTPSEVDSGWMWTCVDGDKEINCGADKPLRVSGVCGLADGVSSVTVPTSGLCTVGNASSISGSGPWTWSCVGLNTGSTVICSADKIKVVTNSCGQSNQGTYQSVPTTNLCANGATVQVYGTGPWNWSCYNSDRTAISNCVAKKTPAGGVSLTASSSFDSGIDTDKDGISDSLELSLGTNPQKADSDGDGYSDKSEILSNHNPSGNGNINIDNAFSKRLAGRILLQVESRGQAWYVNPKDNKRYYLGQPSSALALMRKLSLGVKHKFILDNRNRPYAAQYRGKILLDVEDKGKAYYVDAINGLAYYLGTPDNAFKVIRERGIGIKNNDLAKIKIAF